ncbi:hypothetical protein DM02DRAFT_596040 [Periconia macrospinosa]|uniref:Life-span regulatory factor-domain-containing protein n=1 Tax=Periconia macrospinosa TaxID=97972 RepID=A0A2V1DJW5_9PLEO|nr:hypothetical protein DM02DRAFT_596040 [Periconia macrospinosa]
MATHHTRHLSHHSKRPQPAHARPSKPAPLSKRTSSHGSSKKAAPKNDDVEEEEVMATSFLNFCTTCEKQIIIPSNFVLYCSESCRRKDTEKQLSYSFDYSPPMSPSLTSAENHFRDIVAPRSPTQLPSKRSSIAFSDMSLDDHTPTAASQCEKARHESEASRYLRQFQATTFSSDATSTARPRRPGHNRSYTSHTTSTTPSLSHTPASSVSYSLPYTPATRPLPPRNYSSYASKSIELVTPWPYSTTAPLSPPKYSMKSAPTIERTSSIIEGEILYEKSPVPSISPANGSLGRLLAAGVHV